MGRCYFCSSNQKCKSVNDSEGRWCMACNSCKEEFNLQPKEKKHMKYRIVKVAPINGGMVYHRLQKRGIFWGWNNIIYRGKFLTFFSVDEARKVINCLIKRKGVVDDIVKVVEYV